ncbi:MAG TPA: hypothetical protein VK994_07660, partial [Bacteroidales bacterium]|nr:hypothetical protein [Bacteroidales bacterium]
MKALGFLSLLALTYFPILSPAQGNYWFPQNPAPLVEDLRDISVIDPNTAIVACEEGLILKTTNGGFSWDTLFYHDDPIFSFNKLFFTDEQNGWVIGEMVIKTTNGGVNWYSCPVCLDVVNDIFFIDPQIGYLAGKEGNKATILKTSDGGQSWTPILSDSTLWTTMCVQFISVNVGYAGGYQKVLKTMDGGETWFDIGAPLLGYIVNNIHFADENTGYIVNERGKIARTLDGGASWSVCSYTGLDVRSVYCLGESNAWICGNDTLGFYGVVKHTLDGGYSWTSVIEENSNCVYSIDFLDETAWFVGSHGSAYLSHDEGGNWSKISGSFTKASLLSICFIDQDVGWLSGY